MSSGTWAGAGTGEHVECLFHFQRATIAIAIKLALQNTICMSEESGGLSMFIVPAHHCWGLRKFGDNSAMVIYWFWRRFLVSVSLPVRYDYRLTRNHDVAPIWQCQY